MPKDFKVNPGPVEAIAEQPGHPDNILIGYNRGLMVLWNKATPGAQQVNLLILSASSLPLSLCFLLLLFVYNDVQK